MVTTASERGARWELYRLLSEPVRLRLLALAREEELAVGELAELLDEAQPNVSRHATALRQAGLLAERRQGTRVLVRLGDGVEGDPVVADALAAGRTLAADDGSLGRIADVVAARDAASRAFFSKAREGALLDAAPELPAYLSALALLLPERRLAVDVGTGDGGLLDVLAPVFERVVACDREEAQLARCRARVAARGFANVEVVRGAADDAAVEAAVHAAGRGADVVFAARLLHHAPKPAALLRALVALARPGGAVVVVDYARHEDETMRKEADLWLGFEPAELKKLARAAGLAEVVVRPLPSPWASARPASPDAHLPWQVVVGRLPNPHPHQGARS